MWNVSSKKRTTPGERRRILMPMLEAVHVECKEEKDIVSIESKPAFEAIFEIAETSPEVESPYSRRRIITKHHMRAMTLRNTESFPVETADNVLIGATRSLSVHSPTVRAGVPDIPERGPPPPG